jgi:hypothetical protein
VIVGPTLTTEASVVAEALPVGVRCDLRVVRRVVEDYVGGGEDNSKMFEGVNSRLVDDARVPPQNPSTGHQMLESSVRWLFFSLYQASIGTDVALKFHFDPLTWPKNSHICSIDTAVVGCGLSSSDFGAFKCHFRHRMSLHLLLMAC